LRIRLIQEPTASSIDGIRLDQFQPGFVYDVGNTLGSLFLAEGWAELITIERPALVIPLDEFAPDAKRQQRTTTTNAAREYRPASRDHAVAADRSTSLRGRRRRQTPSDSDPQ